MFPVSGFGFCKDTSESEGFSVSGCGGLGLGSGNDRVRARTKPLSKQWPAIRKQLDFLGANLSKGQLVQAITLLSDARKRRFLRSKRPKYGSMNKGFTAEELERFFRFVECPKLRLLFAYQATLGLRIGEAVRLNIKDLNLRTQELRIFTEKSGKTDFLLVPEKLFQTTLDYIAAYEKEISACRGYLFFSLAPGNRQPTTQPFLATGTVRKLFREIAEKAGLGEQYGYRYGEKAHPLHRLTTHSLRHFSITNFSRKNNGNVTLTSRFARHSNLQTTMTYIHTEKEELYQSIRNSQAEGVLERVKKMQKKIT